MRCRCSTSDDARLQSSQRLMSDACRERLASSRASIVWCKVQMICGGCCNSTAAISGAGQTKVSFAPRFGVLVNIEFQHVDIESNLSTHTENTQNQRSRQTRGAHSLRLHTHRIHPCVDGCVAIASGFQAHLCKPAHLCRPAHTMNREHVRMNH